MVDITATIEDKGQTIGLRQPGAVISFQEASAVWRAARGSTVAEGDTPGLNRVAVMIHHVFANRNNLGLALALGSSACSGLEIREHLRDPRRGPWPRSPGLLPRI